MGIKLANFTLKNPKKSILDIYKMVCIKAKEDSQLNIMFMKVFSTRAKKMVMGKNFTLKLE